MRIYHLLSQKYAMDDLSRGRLKVAAFGDLNDPFELLGVELADRAARQRFTAWRNKAMEQYGLLCFSRRWRNPVLWSHYADKHRGMCLGFDVPDGLLGQVTYLKTRPRVDALVPRAGQASDEPEPLFHMKFEHWRYEGELRRIVPLREALAEGDWHFWPFGQDLQLREVVAGPRCPITKAQLQDALRDRSRGVTLTRARLAFKTFEVVTQQRGFRDSKSPNNRLERSGSTPAAQPERLAGEESAWRRRVQ